MQMVPLLQCGDAAQVGIGELCRVRDDARCVIAERALLSLRSSYVIHSISWLVSDDDSSVRMSANAGVLQL